MEEQPNNKLKNFIMNKKILGRIKRHRKIRKFIIGTDKVPRLTVFRSNKYIYAQLVDDVSRKTILAVSEKELTEKGNKSENSRKLGELIAKKAMEKKLKQCVFDRGGYSYHGRIKNFAEAARSGGLVF